MNSCWVIHFSNGTMLLVNDPFKDKIVYVVVDGNVNIEREEHWFDEEKARKKYPQALVVRQKG